MMQREQYGEESLPDIQPTRVNGLVRGDGTREEGPSQCNIDFHFIVVLYSQVAVQQHLSTSFFFLHSTYAVLV